MAFSRPYNPPIPQSDVTGLIGHTHLIGDVGGLQAVLDSKLSSTGNGSGLTGLTSSQIGGLGTASTKNTGEANGVCPLDGTGKVAATYLPSFVDDVIESSNAASLPVSGETGKLYVTLDNGKVFRWSGSAYVEISASPGSTDAVPEGASNLYFTAARSKSASVVDSLAGSQTDQSPSVASVNVALANKQPSDATLTALAAWDWSSGVEVPTFTAADTLSVLRVGTAANNLVQLNGSGQLPAVSGANLTNLPASGNSVGQSVFGTTTTYNGTLSAFSVKPCTITYPSTGCYRVSVLIPLRILVAATVTAQMACGTCAIASTNGDVIGTCDNSRSGGIAACTVSTGSPTVISLASRPDIANMCWMAELIIDVSTAGTMELQLSGAGSTANHFTVVKGAYVRWEKLS